MSDAPETTKLSMANTKKEMLKAYHRVLKQLQQKEEAEMRPEETVAQRKRSKAIGVADAVSSGGIADQIASLHVVDIDEKEKTEVAALFEKYDIEADPGEFRSIVPKVYGRHEYKLFKPTHNLAGKQS